MSPPRRKVSISFFRISHLSSVSPMESFTAFTQA